MVKPPSTRDTKIKKSQTLLYDLYATTTIRIRVNSHPPVALAFEKPTSLEELPDGRMLVSENGGKLYT
ncbi:MAG: hypothetical protein QGF59_32700, partial [Pirellulaceae bacterium]|nr:hypothetical protein [Pirellulaceae bacterium]